MGWKVAVPVLLLLLVGCIPLSTPTPAPTPTPTPDPLMPVAEAHDMLRTWILKVLTEGEEWPPTDKDLDWTLRHYIRTLIEAPDQWQKFGRPYLRVEGKQVGHEIAKCMDQYKAAGEAVWATYSLRTMTLLRGMEVIKMMDDALDCLAIAAIPLVGP